MIDLQQKSADSRPGSAVERRRNLRRVQRYLVTAFFVLIIVQLFIPIFYLIPVAIVGAFSFFVYRHYRRPAADRPTFAAAARHTSVPRVFGEAWKPEEAPVAPDLAGEVAMLEGLRREAAAESRRRVWTYVPLGLAPALLVIPGGGNFVALLMVAGTGMFFGWAFAVFEPGGRYAKAFKTALLPRLLARHGAFTYRSGEAPRLERCNAVSLLPRHNRVMADDAFEGTHRERPIRITELTLEQASGKSTSTVFQGLLLEIGLAAPVRGTTVVRDKDRATEWMASVPHGLPAVEVDDPVFAETYQVLASDPAAAHAILTPAVMARLLGLADREAFFPPFLLAEGDRMVFAIGRDDGRDMFEPPSLSSHGAALQLATLEEDIACLFRLADAMIEIGQPG